MEQSPVETSKSLQCGLLPCEKKVLLKHEEQKTEPGAQGASGSGLK
jgi:hypothetical protein